MSSPVFCTASDAQWGKPVPLTKKNGHVFFDVLLEPEIQQLGT